MQNVHSSGWLLKGFLVAALVSCGSFVYAAEPEAKKRVPLQPRRQPLFRSRVLLRVSMGPLSMPSNCAVQKVLLRGQTVPAEQQAILDKQAVEQLISAELLYQAAAKLEIKDLDNQIDAKIAQGRPASRMNRNSKRPSRIWRWMKRACVNIPAATF